MAFDPRQFKIKKKRAVDPAAPPRPNLLSHDKTIREQNDIINRLQMQVQQQAEQIQQLKSNYNNMQSSIDKIVGYLRKN